MRIGPIQLSQPFCQAGLAGYSDRAMRLVARRRGCPYAVTEALLDTILVNGGEGLRKSIDISDEDHPVAGQIIGSEPETMAKAARLLQQAGYDVIDLNFACPVKKIKNKARGGHMLIDVPRATAIIKAVRDALPPSAITTVSLRRGFDESNESLDRFHEIMETIWANGYAAVRVHARTVEQKYLGQSRWDFLKSIKAKWPDKTILGSGDVFTAEDVVRMLEETGVDLVWIARGAIGNPWIFQHAAELLKGSAEGSGFRVQGSGKTDASSPSALNPQPRTLNPPRIHDQRDALAEHFGIAMQIHGEQLAGRRMRKMGIKYSRFHPAAAEVKADFINVHSLRDWTAVLEKHYAMDAPGVWPAATAADEVNTDQSCEAAA
ncbi:MAG: tRNA-dihydrouridine synthase family protein [Tepidisphaeraceae bacterium]